MDYRELARRRLPRFLFDYIDGGSYGEVTLKRNTGDLERLELRQRVLRDVSAIDLSATLFGERAAMPVGLGPVGIAGLNWRRGETQAVRAAEAFDIPFTLSTVSACSIAEVANAANRPFWFQLYLTRDRGFMRDMLAQAQEAGCRVLLFTVDTPVAGPRYRDTRSGLHASAGRIGALRRLAQAIIRPRWAWDVGLRGGPHTLGNVAPYQDGGTGLPDMFRWLKDNQDSSVTWRDVEDVRAAWKGQLVIKGVLDVDDARRAVMIGADGIVVSNHGGRQLDGVPSTARALPAIADAVSEDLTILADGGVRSGLDVVRLLALGAHGVLLGRAWVYALAAAGRDGVEHMLAIIDAEIRIAMALTGTTQLDTINRDMLVGGGIPGITSTSS